MFHIILYQPEIPPNTGNIIRLCANTGSQLHLIHPLGFTLEDKRLRRAGLDYHEFAQVQQYDNLNDCLTILQQPRLFLLTTKGNKSYTDISFQPNDAFIFGPETRGLPNELLNSHPKDNQLFIPQRKNSRSLNLSNSVSIVLYEAWRQINFQL